MGGVDGESAWTDSPGGQSPTSPFQGGEAPSLQTEPGFSLRFFQLFRLNR